MCVAGWFSSSGQEYLIFCGRSLSVQATEKNGKYFVNICRQDGPTKGHRTRGKCVKDDWQMSWSDNEAPDVWEGEYYTIPLEMINEARIIKKNITHPCLMLVTHVALISLYK